MNQDQNDDDVGSCECPDISKLLMTDSRYNATAETIASCISTITCNCGPQETSQSVCGLIYLTFEDLDNFTARNGTLLAPTALIFGNTSYNIFDDLGFQCQNGSWYITKMIYGMWYSSSDDGFVRQIYPEFLVGTSAKVQAGKIGCGRSTEQ